MATNLRKPAISLAGAFALVLASALPAASAPPPMRPIDPPVRVVSLGDSYSSGQGVDDRLPSGNPWCRKSTRSFPRWTLAKLKARVGETSVSLEDSSCASATIDDLYATQTTSGTPNPPQLQALTGHGHTDFVTIGFGANDVNLLGVISRCKSVYSVGRESCRAAHARRGLDPFADVAAVASRVRRAITDVRSRAPEAVLLVVGYPDILPPAGDSDCVASMGVGPDDMRWLDSLERDLDDMLASQALLTGARFVDTYAASIGHDACRAPSQRWVEPVFSAADGDITVASLHPTAKGQQGIASEVIATIYQSGA